MGMNYMDAEALKQAFLAGAEALEARKEWINELVSRAGRRYRNEYGNDDSVGCQRGGSD